MHTLGTRDMIAFFKLTIFSSILEPHQASIKETTSNEHPKEIEEIEVMTALGKLGSW